MAKAWERILKALESGKCFVSLIIRGQQNLVLFVLSMGYARILLGKSECLLGKEFILIIYEVCEDVRVKFSF